MPALASRGAHATPAPTQERHRARLKNAAGIQGSTVLSRIMSGVIVVGAGFAGLAAARRLRQAGVSPVLVLEACSAVGGRARTLRLSPELGLEMGATWIHGIRGPQGDPNPILALAQEQGLLGPDPPEYAWQDAHFLQPGRAALLEPDEVRCIEACSEAFMLGLEPAQQAEEGATLADAVGQAWTQVNWHGAGTGGVGLQPPPTHPRIACGWGGHAPRIWGFGGEAGPVGDGAGGGDRGNPTGRAPGAGVQCARAPIGLA